MNLTVLQALAIAATTRIPTLIEGDPGLGKTELFLMILKALGISPTNEEHYAWILNSSSADPSDFSGPLTKGIYNGVEVSRYTPPEDVVRLQLSKPGRPNPYAAAMGYPWETTGCAVFIGEFTTLYPRVQAPLLAMFDVRKSIGTHPLPVHCWTVADCNPPDIATNGQEISFPMRSRMMMLPWEVSVSKWADAMLNDFPPINISVVPDEWVSHLPVSKALIASFAKSNQEAIYSPSYFRNLTDANRDSQYPTLRPWTWFIRANAAWMAMGCDEEVRFTMLAGLVGNGAAQAFAAYCEKNELPNTEAWLEDPNTFSISKRGDIAVIGLTSMVAHITQAKNPKWWANGWEILNKCFEIGKGDLAIMSCPPLIPLFRTDPKKFPITKQNLEKFLPMMKASGMI
jgi:hypothetical protein